MDELDTFKSRINLTEYAVMQGYVLDKRESGRASATMRHPNGDKIIIGRAASGHWIYFSVRNSSDNGTIIDFIQNRRSVSLGDIRRDLRGWTGAAVSPALFARELKPSTKDRTRVAAIFAKAEGTTQHPYLNARGIPSDLQASSRFAGSFKMDGRGNVLFPHRDHDGLCGFEIKNHDFTGFATGGEKGLWFSRTRQSDLSLVFAESAIDAMSYAALHPCPATRYASTAGKMNPTQPELIKAAIQRMPNEATIIIATDNDSGGDDIAGEIEDIARGSGRVMRRDQPVHSDADWNDILRRINLEA